MPCNDRSLQILKTLVSCAICIVLLPLIIRYRYVELSATVSTILNLISVFGYFLYQVSVLTCVTNTQCALILSASVFVLSFFMQLIALSCSLLSFMQNFYAVPCPLHVVTLIHLHLLPIAFISLAIDILYKYCCMDKQSDKQDYKSIDNHDLADRIDIKTPIASYLTFESIKKLKVRQEDTVCRICRREYGNKDLTEVLQPCSHYFHKNCIDAWKRIKADYSCPICKIITIVTVK